MNLKDLHLENIPIPSDFKEIILERKEITPELKEQNYTGDVRDNGRRYNYFKIDEGYEPFRLLIIEQNVGADPGTGVLEYMVEMDTAHALFKPSKLQKYISKHKAGRKFDKFNQKLGAWLIVEIEKLSGVEMYDDLYVQTSDRYDFIAFKIYDDKIYDQLRIDISTALRALSATTWCAEDEIAAASGDLNFVEDKLSIKKLKSIENRKELNEIFRDVVCHNYVTTVYFAVKEAIKILQARKQKTDNLFFVIDIDKERIRFTLDEDYPDCDDDQYFYNHKVAGDILIKFDCLCHLLNLSPSSEAAYYFGQALHILDEKGVFDNVMDSIFEIMGSYNYRDDMEGIFCK